MGFLTPFSSKIKRSLAMEISTASINVMLFENGSADKPKITAHYRRQQSFEMLRDVEKFQRFTLINISDLFQEIRKKEQDSFKNRRTTNNGGICRQRFVCF